MSHRACKCGARVIPGPSGGQKVVICYERDWGKWIAECFSCGRAGPIAATEAEAWMAWDANHAEGISVRVERAACADIADQYASCEGIAQKIAVAIRARGECAEDPRLAQARATLERIRNRVGREFADGINRHATCLSWIKNDANAALAVLGGQP